VAVGSGAYTRLLCAGLVLQIPARTRESPRYLPKRPR
jgi:hypothetical protein